MFLKRLIRHIWEFPQTLLALLFLAVSFLDRKRETFFIHSTKVIYFGKSWGAISLGPYIFICHALREKSEMHEFGHSRQSMMLGPLYLIVIGAPSFIHAFLRLMYFGFTGGKLPKRSYYAFYTERWADLLGGVER